MSPFNRPMKSRPKLFVISAPSGTGKTTVVRRLLSHYPHVIESVSYTTRAPRAGEVHGTAYFFVDRRTFERLVGEGFFAEWAEVHGAFYGTPAEPICRALAGGMHMVLDIDVQGGMTLKKAFPEAATIFLMPPSEDELTRRLRGRGTEAEDAIARRLANAHREMTFKDRYDYCVVNDEVDRAVEEIAKIMQLQNSEDSSQ